MSKTYRLAMSVPECVCTKVGLLFVPTGRHERVPATYSVTIDRKQRLNKGLREKYGRDLKDLITL